MPKTPANYASNCGLVRDRTVRTEGVALTMLVEHAPVGMCGCSRALWLPRDPRAHVRLGRPSRCRTVTMTGDQSPTPSAGRTGSSPLLFVRASAREVGFVRRSTFSSRRTSLPLHDLQDDASRSRAHFRTPAPGNRQGASHCDESPDPACTESRQRGPTSRL